MNKNIPSKKPTSNSTSGGSNANTHKPPPSNPAPSIKPAAPQNGYTPKYTPPADPIAIPAPNVENRIDIPSRLDVVTLDDLCSRITDNASVLLPGQRIKLSTARAPSGLLYHALVLVPRNPERESSRWRVEVRGPGVGVKKGEEGRGRREALEALLGELEGRVGREMLGGT